MLQFHLHHSFFYLACPEHISRVENVFNDILQGIEQDKLVFNNSDEMSNAIRILNIDLDTLLKLKKENATATARSILKYKFPNPIVNFKLGDVNEAIANAVVYECIFFISMIYLCLLYSLFKRISSE